MQPKTPLFTSGSQHPPRFGHAVYLGEYMHGDLCKHLGIDSSTDHPDRYSNLFLNAYIIAMCMPNT